MQAQLYVGNLSYSTTDEDLQGLFEQYGEVISAQVIRFADSGRSKGVGFGEMGDGEQAEKSLEQDGKDFQGRNIRVSEAKPPSEKKEFRPRDGGGDGGGGYRN